LLARYYLQVGSQKQAKKQYETIIQLSPEDAKANLALASFDNGNKKGNDLAYTETLQELFKQEEALAAYQTTLTLDDTSFPVWENIMQIYINQKEYDKLIKLTEEAMDLFPNRGIAYLYNGMALKEQGISSLKEKCLYSTRRNLQENGKI